MIQLVAPGKEPITPFVRIVRSLHEQLSLSTILVIGGTGDYFDVADHVLVMDSYRCEDATERAKEIVRQFAGNNSTTETSANKLWLTSSSPRGIMQPSKLKPDGKVKATRTGLISYGNTEVDLSAVEQIVSVSQTSAISNVLQKIANGGEAKTLRDVLQSIDETIDQDGLDALAPGQFHGGLTRPRMLEVGAAVNRLRVQGALTQIAK